MAYLPVEDYGVVGDLHTVALIGKNGSIDWLCYPHFDSPSIFGALLDEKIGGSFRLSPIDDGVKNKQMYLPDTNVLITRFLKPTGVAEITDFMPIEDDEHKTWKHRLVRRVCMVRGSLTFEMFCKPGFDYARVAHQAEQHPSGVVFRSDDLHLGLTSDQPLQITEDGAAYCSFTLQAGQSATFLLHRVEEGSTCDSCPAEAEVDHIFKDTVDYWRKWLRQCTYHGRWREMVTRSALVLKLLTFAPTGAIVAAPTTSIPEAIGGSRNWDYRYTWIRDASFTAYALLRLGFYDDVGNFMNFIEQRCREIEKHGGLQIMYGIDGRHILEEYTLDHLSGYQNSRPVRIGNGAYKQLQLDIYGELMDAIYLYNKFGQLISYDQWVYVRSLTDWLCDNWQKPDDGLWEVRSGKMEFVYSRMMCWVALDRALRIANKRGLPADTVLWQNTRDEIYEQIMNKGWNEELQSFVQYYGSNILDASNLLMPLVKFLGPTDPKMLKTLNATLENLTYDTLVYRYDTERGANDGLVGREGTFSLCSFWLVECLTRAGRLDEARLKLEKMFSYANHLGLFAEEIGTSGEMLGNYPQAFTHLSLISAAYNLDMALNK